MLDRRQFAMATTALLSASAGWSPLSACEPPASLEAKQLVGLGLNALARAPEMNYFADGHRGAAMISAHLMCVDNELSDEVGQRIVQLFEANWALTQLCAPFAEADPVADATQRVGRALAEGSGVLREVGHDAIFAMHAIKGFRLLPELATAERVAGVCQLIRAIKPWRDIAPDPRIAPPPFSDSAAAAQWILREASDAIDRFRGFGQGFAGHMLTFGQALVELADMGDVEWAESCRTAFCKYVTVTRQGPQAADRPIKDHAYSALRPNQESYWQQRRENSLGIGHVFKYPYAYYDLLARAQDPQLQQQLEAKAWELF